MCDDTGLFQHAVHSVPDRAHGYCVDDNARALLLACALNNPGEKRLSEILTARFAAFVQHAWNPDTKRFRNFMGFNRTWLEDCGSEDSHGRTLWALGECARRDASPSRRRWAAALFAEALPAVEAFGSPRALAFTLLGLDGYCAVAPDDARAREIRYLLADSLMSGLASVETPDWTWFEEGLAYDNARLPQALMLTGMATQTPEYLDAGLRSLRWLMTQQTSPTGHFRPVGTAGFGELRQPPRAFDQQPVEATATIAACLTAWRADGDAEWKAIATNVFAWFLGRNDLSIALVDPETGSCRDGLHPDRANENRGGESVVSYLLGLADIRQLARVNVGVTSPIPRRFAPSAPEFSFPSNEPRTSCRKPLSCTGKRSICVPTPRELSYARSSRRLNRAISTRPTRRVPTISSNAFSRSTRRLQPPIGRCAGKLSRAGIATCWRRSRPVPTTWNRRWRLTALFQASSANSSAPIFCNEYSFEASALFNPSIVPHPDQSEAPKGGLRFILSLRAVGEGHVSSLTFRAGTIAADGSLTVDPTARLASSPRVKLRVPKSDGDEVELTFNPDEELSERVIFPVTDSQSNGIEDARFVEFSDGGRKTYYATYTAYSGKAIRSELIETSDFLSFRMSPLQGTAARNKGMALFPRKIDGKYAMIARQDNENLYLIYSDDLHTWDGGQAILKPQFPWEFVQIGNCGSPIELDEGWLLLTHGVGPVRKYSIGAALLDKNDPSKVLARSVEPLLHPEPSEREGYVPNVVYTCGAMRHNDQIILPYAVSDTYSNFATIRIAALMQAMS